MSPFLLWFSRKTRFWKEVWLEKNIVSWSEVNSWLCQKGSRNILTRSSIMFDRVLNMPLMMTDARYWQRFSNKIKYCLAYSLIRHSQHLFLTIWQYLQYEWWPKCMKNQTEKLLLQNEIKTWLFRQNIIQYSICNSIHSLKVHFLRIWYVILPICIKIALMMYHINPLGMIKRFLPRP